MRSSAEIWRRAKTSYGGIKGFRDRLDEGAEGVFGAMRRPTKVVVPPDEETVCRVRALTDKYSEEELNGPLDPVDQIRLEAAVEAIARPALFVDDGTFRVPQGWSVLGRHKQHVEEGLSAVGRIELHRPGRVRTVGTGFVVAPNIVMTNRHVVDPQLAEWDRSGWRLSTSSEVAIDFAEERRGNYPPREHVIEDVLFVSNDPAMDVALLAIRMRDRRGEPSPAPLAIGVTRRPRQGSIVCVLGYPTVPNVAKDSPVRQIADIVFARTYGVKRVQPGRVVRANRLEIQHDCSTLGGNSGSCLLDPITGYVVGLHWGGVTNFALALARIVDSPPFSDLELSLR